MSHSDISLGVSTGGTARVFDGCDLTIIPGSGSTGFSRCMVTTSHDLRAGGTLTRVYYDNRVLPDDKFTVPITP